MKVNLWNALQNLWQYSAIQRHKRKRRANPDYPRTREALTDRVLGGIVLTGIAIVSAPALVVPTIAGYLVYGHLINGK